MICIDLLYIYIDIYIYIHFQKCFSGRLGRKSWVFKTGMALTLDL